MEAPPPSCSRAEEMARSHGEIIFLRFAFGERVLLVRSSKLSFPEINSNLADCLVELLPDRANKATLSRFRLPFGRQSLEIYPPLKVM